MAQTGFDADAERLLAETDEEIGATLQRAAERTIEYLRSYTDMASKGRPAHPGGWADRTKKLRDSYGYEVVRRSRGQWAIIITNNAPHAHLVEARDGLFVVRGVDAAGGPVDRAFRKALAEVAPDTEIRGA